MKIYLSPQRRDDTLTVSKAGDVLTINGDGFDFSELPNGATLPAGVVPCDWIVGPVERVSGQVHLTLILPHGPSPSQAVAFPAPLVNPPNGLLVLPFDPPPAPLADGEEDPDPHPAENVAPIEEELDDVEG